MKVNGWCWLLMCLGALSSCSSRRYFSTPILQAEKDFKDHIGFVVYDPGKEKTLYTHQGDRYFTPASNTKIFTYYTSLVVLGDSVPALRYEQRNDSLIFWGTGDPGFLYENTHRENRVYNFLKSHPSKLFFSSANFDTEYLGPGWAWDDSNDYYQVERTPFPIYGNIATVKRANTKLTAFPDIFTYTVADSSQDQRAKMVRGSDSNTLTYTPGKTDRPRQWNIPFHCSDQLLVKLLSDTLKREVKLISLKQPMDAKALYSIKADSLYKVMMQASDNFIAEQLLMLCSGVISDTLSSEKGIQFIKNKFLADLPDEPIWVDGSGLSRYNLFTPRSIVRLWEKIYKLVPADHLSQVLAVGGESGTIKNQYKGDKPFIIGKTGSLSNHHTLSGFLVTKRGRTLIFSWMNNNFTVSSSEIRERMEVVLKRIYEKY